MKPGDGVDPGQVPFRTLYTGARMPGVGLGTFGSDHASPAAVGSAVRAAIRAGYRHIDCASVYGNEAEVGAAIREAVRDGVVRREDLWITSKVWNDMHGKRNVMLSCARSLRDLGLDYLDMCLVHWPFPNTHSAGCSVDARSPDARAYLHEEYMETWGAMERLVGMGMTRHAGTSNMTVPKLRLVLRDARIRPACEEMELHPHFQQQELFDFVTASGMVPVGYSPVGSPARPERDRTPDDTVDVEDPVVRRIAAAHGIHPATLCVKWGAQRGHVPIPFTTSLAHGLENLRCVTTPPLSAAEMEAIAGIDRNCRLIKGHVFLWKDGQTWEALWDTDGRITPP
ncbi:MAG: aldo/keto reductase [Candidatus Coatesbacteria bacterium]